LDLRKVRSSFQLDAVDDRLKTQASQIVTHAALRSAVGQTKAEDIRRLREAPISYQGVLRSLSASRARLGSSEARTGVA
jgi:hypothetical protein